MKLALNYKAFKQTLGRTMPIRSRSVRSAPRKGPEATLPVELWHKIFILLRRNDHISLSQTCSNFRYIAQRLLFHKAAIQPFIESPCLSASKHKAIKDALMERLAFFQEERISTVVSKLSIYPPKVLKRPAELPQPVVPLSDIIDHIFAILHKFPNLTRLTCRSIAFTDGRLDKLRGLQLKSLVLTSCFMTSVSSSEPLNLPLQSLIFNQTTRGIALDPHKPDPHFLSLFLYSPSLRRFTTTIPDEPLFAFVIAESMSSLTELELPLQSAASPYLPKALATCTALTTLSFVQSSSSEVTPTLKPMPTECIPAITTFRGPHSYIYKLCDNQKLVNLSVTVMCRPESVQDSLSFFGLCTSLESFSIRTRRFNVALLCQIHDSFPELAQLRIVEPILTPSAWSAILAIPPPHAYPLRSLQFSLAIGNLSDFWVPPHFEIVDTIQLFGELYPSMMKRYPLLRRLMLVYSNNRMRDGLMAMMWEPTKHHHAGDPLDADDISVEVDSQDIHNNGRSLLADERKVLSRMRA